MDANLESFDAWNEKKKALSQKSRTVFCYPREIWWCSIGLNIGHEENGKNKDFSRPVLVLARVGLDGCYIVPLTTSISKNRYRMPLGDVAGKKSFAITSQIKSVDTKRFIQKIGLLDQETFERIRKAARDLF